jgi:hypothetical protein
MTKEELKQIQSICREWLRQPDTAKDSRLTIPLGGALSRAFALKINALLTFDNVLIMSADDADTGVSYATLIRQPDGAEEIFDTPFEKIPTESSVASEPAPERATQKRYRLAMEELAERQRRDAAEAATQAVELDTLWIERDHSASEPQPKFLLYSDGKLLGYSLLERDRSAGQRSGRFHPGEDYFEYAHTFQELPEAENECLEINVREAYEIFEDGSDAVRMKFYELAAKVDQMKLYIEDESGTRINTSTVRLEDLSLKYDDESERWLYVTVDSSAS